jgi:hypothetical protein
MIVVAWLLFPPLALAALAIVIVPRLSQRFILRHRFHTWSAIAVLSSLMTLALLALDPAPGPVSRILSVQDHPFVWAPFAFISVTLASPLAIWWANRDEKRPED